MPLLAEVSENGYAIYVPRFPCGMAFLDVGAAEGIMDEHPEIHAWYIAGHSMGGQCASRFAASHADDLLGVISISSRPDKALANTNLPLLMLYGDLDGIFHGLKRRKH